MAKTGRASPHPRTEQFAVPADWDAWLDQQGAGAGYCQTSHWAGMFKAAHGGDAFALCVEEGRRRVAGVLLTRRPAQKKGAVGRIKGWLSGDSLECLEGPVLAGPNKVVLLRSLLEKTDALALELSVRNVRFFGRPPAASDWPGTGETSALFADFGYTARPWLTALVDLTTPEDMLRKGFRHAARKGIRKCEAAGVGVDICASYEKFEHDFLEPYYEAMKDEGRFTGPLTNMEALWETDGGRHYRYFVARDPAGTPLALLGTYAYNGVATEIMSIVTVPGRASKLPAQDLLHWEVFRTHKAAGDDTFNLAGFSAEPADAKETGIRRFKEKWGGRIAEVPQFERENTPLRMRLARRARAALRSRRSQPD